MLALLALDPDEPTVTNSGDGMGNGGGDGLGQGKGSDLIVIFLRLIELDDADLRSVNAVVMGETLASGSAIIEVIGQHIAMDMAPYWQADDAFFELLRDREVLTAMMEEVAGATIASANAGEKVKVIKTIIRGHLSGADGREKHQNWVPRWMAFPPAAYSARGGVGTVDRAALAGEARTRRTLSKVPDRIDDEGPRGEDELPAGVDGSELSAALDGSESPDDPDRPDRPDERGGDVTLAA